MKNNSKIRQMVCTACGILGVGTLLCFAMLFPGHYCKFLDSNSLNKVAYTDIEIKTYETAYASFAEKLHALARANTIGSSLHAVPVNEPGIKRTRKETTKIANQELKKLNHLNILSVDRKLDRKKMTLCERYTIYETNNTNSLKGISIWKLIYENKKRTVTLYLDEEYHKIYSLNIIEKHSTPYTDTDSDASASTSSKVSVYQNDFWQWWDGLLRYYDLLFYNQMVSQNLGDSGLYGVILFEKQYHETQYEMVLYRSNTYDKYKNTFWTLGIPLERMIQF